MPAPGWFNENENRAYPFLRETVNLDDGPLTIRHLPNAAIVDAGFVLGPKSRFETALHTVYLNSIRRSGTTFYFEFLSDAPELYGTPLIFTRDLADPDYTTEFLTSEQSGLSESSEQGVSDSEAECYEPLWSGFLVTGGMAELDTFLSGDGIVLRGDGAGVLEPGVLQNLAGAFVTKLGVANADRTRTDAPTGCLPTEYPFARDEIWVQDACLVNDVVFEAGYNASVQTNAAENSITIGAAVGAGAGEPCEEVPLGPNDQPPSDSALLTGGLRCNEVLRSINGVAGPAFTIETDLGASVLADPDNNRVIIDVDMRGLAICFTPSESSESL